MQCHRASPWLAQAAATLFPLGRHLAPWCGETTWPNGAGWSCGHGSANPRCGSPMLFGKLHPCTTWQAWFDSNHFVDMWKNILRTKANKNSRDMDSKNGKLCKLCGRNNWIEKYIWYKHQIVGSNKAILQVVTKNGLQPNCHSWSCSHWLHLWLL